MDNVHPLRSRMFFRSLLFPDSLIVIGKEGIRSDTIPVYQFFLTDNDFCRATNSLQLDETIGILASKIIGSNGRLALINNKHPTVPLSTLRAGFRFVLHGLATEQLHALLVELKNKQAA